MLAPYSSKSVWNEYLRSAHTIEGIGAHIDNLGGNLQLVGKVISHSMSANAEKIVASQEILATILDGGMHTLDRSLKETTFAIEDLRAEFSYNLALLIDQAFIQNSTLNGIKKILEGIYGIAANRIKTDARELYLDGCEQLQRGLLDEALDFFHRSEKMYYPDFFTQLNIGKLYLYGVNDDCNIIDIEKAEKHLKMAVRYGKAILPQKPEMAKPTAEAYLHASMVSYLIAMKNTNEQERAGKLREALNLAREGYTLNRNLSEAAYHLVKYSLMVGNIENDSELITSGLKSLDDLMMEVPKYSIKVSLDRDLDANRDAIDNLITAARDKLNVKVRDKLSNRKIWDRLSAMDFSVSFVDTNKLNEAYGRLVEYEQALHQALNQLVRTLPFQWTNRQVFNYEVENQGGHTEQGFFVYENKKWQRIHELFSARQVPWSGLDLPGWSRLYLLEGGKEGLQQFSAERQKLNCSMLSIDSVVNFAREIEAEKQNKLERAKLDAKSIETLLQRSTYLDSHQADMIIGTLNNQMSTLEDVAVERIQMIRKKQKYLQEVLVTYTSKLEHIEKSIREKSCIVCSKKPKLFNITLGEKKIPLCRRDRPMKWKLQ